MLFLTEDDVLALFPMKMALERVEASFKAQGEHSAVNMPRTRLFLPDVSLHYMAAALPSEGLLGMKIYTVSRGSFRFVVLLFEAGRGVLLALIEADHLGRIRTGAASGVATRYLSRAGAETAGVIGSGRQAKTQLEAVAQVRKIRSVRVFSRDEARRRQFAREMSERLRIEVEPVESAEAAARFGDVMITATTAREPVLKGEWLKPGAHVNAIGANMENRREVDDGLLRRASVIAVDSVAQARIESGDLIQGFSACPREWDRVTEMWTIIAGERTGRKSPEDVTLFKSAGIALWDVAAAGAVYRQAIELGRGKEIALSEAESR
ncbi:MAG TPA: ornithine cyclodeaminase family protein [Terriglobia bacterium]|nr:ornithine cyclodeaminase family protein [Terriglobia bacterium]